VAADRSEVEKISLLEQEWGWTPPKRVFEQIRESANKQKQPISQPPGVKVGSRAPSTARCSVRPPNETGTSTR